ALAEALVAWYRDGNAALLDAYSETCLRRVWRAEHFSWRMTTMLHRAPNSDEFTLRLQQSQLRYLRTSPAAARSLAENYVGGERAGATGRPGGTRAPRGRGDARRPRAARAC